MFIECVHGKPAIWDRGLRQYSNKNYFHRLYEKGVGITYTIEHTEKLNKQRDLGFKITNPTEFLKTLSE